MKFAIILLVIYASTVIAERRDEKFPMVLCGRKLAQTLATVCISVQEAESKEIPMQNEHFKSNMNRKLRKRSTPAEECCDKECLLEDLMQFC